MLAFTVSDMTCSGCVKAITGAVHAIDAAATINADLDSRIVQVVSAASADTLADAMRDAGFTVAKN